MDGLCKKRSIVLLNVTNAEQSERAGVVVVGLLFWSFV